MAVHVLVGTKAAAFVYTTHAQRREWTVSKPLMPGFCPEEVLQFE